MILPMSLIDRGPVMRVVINYIYQYYRLPISLSLEGISSDYEEPEPSINSAKYFC